MREVKEKKEAEAKAIEDEREEARKNYVPIAKRIAKVTKKTVRDAKDLYTELKHAAGTRIKALCGDFTGALVACGAQ
jgi:diadenosine tetraphosphate (Ap4A) HIT family hydrolase